MIYFDNSATTQIHPEVLEKMNEVMIRNFGNPSSLHKLGIDAENEINLSREIIANTLNINKSNIFFTSGGTESNNIAILSKRRLKHAVTSKIEHPSVLKCFKNLESQGVKVDYISPNSEGFLEIDEINSKITEETGLISIMHVNNEIGSIQPIEKIDKKNALFHVDCVQSYGKIPIYAKNIDMISISAHKIHGPKGVGALAVKSGVHLKPLFEGGGQERGLRSGTENTAGISGFAKAAQIAFRSHNNILEIKEYMTKRIIEEIGSVEIISPKNSIDNILCIAFKSVKRAEVLLHRLAEKEIYVSTGAACSSKQTSHVLKAMNSKYVNSSIRFSFSYFNNPVDVDECIAALKSIL